MIRVMYDILAIAICLFCYLCVALGTLFVLKIGFAELFGIELKYGKRR